VIEMPKYYLWDWHGTKTIHISEDLSFANEERAKLYGAFRSFKECKAHGICEIKKQMSDLREDLTALQKLKRSDI
jgi:hypothetical protein